MKQIIFPTDTEPIEINISFKKFVNLLKDFNEGESKYINDIIEALKPTIEKWSLYINTKNMYADFTIYSICKFLDSDNKPIGTAESKLDIYLEYNARSEISIEEDLILLFSEFFNKKTINPYADYTKPIKLYFHIAMEMKYLIFVHIRKIIQLCKRDLYFYRDSLYFTYQNESYEESQDIIYIFDQIHKINPWHSYLFKLICEGFSIKERCKILYLTPKELHKEENLIWQLLKQKQLDNLIQLDQM